MRFLLDSCVSRFAVAALRSSGQGVVWVPEAGPDPGDDELLAGAARERRILVTLDKDFGELVFVQGRLHGGIVRLLAMPVREQATSLLNLIRSHSTDLEAGAMIVVERGRVRVLQPPSSPGA